MTLRHPASPQVRLETLEPRLMLSGQTFLVDSLQDVVASDGMVTLREAIEAANTNTAVTDDVPAGSAAEMDEITFDIPALQAEAGPGNPLVIGLTEGQLNVRDSLTLAAPASTGITIDAQGNSRVLYIPYTANDVVLKNLTVTGGVSVQDGGGIFTSAHTTLVGVDVTGNTAIRYEHYKGGGIYSYGSLTMIDSTVSGNEAGEWGGGIWHGGVEPLVIVNSQIEGNTAKSGGGLFNDGQATLINSLVHGNHGGGILNDNIIALNYVTVTGNISTRGCGGICNNVFPSIPAMTIDNSIVALNEGADEHPNLDGPFVSNARHHNLIGIDPGFVDPAAGDYRLTGGSPAIDRADASLLPTDTHDLDGDGDTSEPLPVDLGGNDRLVGGGLDIGAFERQSAVIQESPSTVVTTLADTVDALDGDISLREALFYGQLSGSTVTFDQGLAGGTVSLNGGELSIYDAVTLQNPDAGVTIDAGGTSRVMWIATAGAAVSLEGLTLTGGMLNSEHGRGGGLLNLDGDLRLDDVSVIGNSIYNGVGNGIFNGGMLTMTGGAVRDNVSTVGSSIGSGVYNNNVMTIASAEIVGNNGLDQIDNRDWRHWGATRDAELTLIDCSVTGNTAGRGIYNDGDLLLIESTVSGNAGPGIFSRDRLELVNTVVRGNVSPEAGGGIYAVGPTVVTGSLIADNEAVGSGGGLYAESGELTIANSTIAGNTSGDAGGGIYIYRAAVTMTNSIVATNAAVDSTDIAGSVAGSRNLVGYDPSFADPAGGDYRLSAESVAIGGGDTSLLPADVRDVDDDGDVTELLPLDLDGEPRVFGASVDQGAYEYRSMTAPEDPSTVVTTLADISDSMDGAISLREAIHYAMSDGLGDAVTFDAGLAGGAIRLAHGQLTIHSSLTVDATDIGGITIDAVGQSRVFSLSAAGAEVTLAGLTIAGGQTDGSGGGIYNDKAILILDDVTLNGNAAAKGGGLYSDYGSELRLTDVDITGNTAAEGGGLYTYKGTFELTRVAIYNNEASGGAGKGGGIYHYHGGDLFLTDVDIYENAAGDDGGGVYADGRMTMTGGSIANNSAASAGGGVYNESNATLMGVALLGNTAGWRGGGIYNYYYTTTLTNCVLSDNEAGSGGAIYTTEGYGGYGRITATNCTIVGNTATREGGGVMVDSEALAKFYNSIVALNSAGVDGDDLLLGPNGYGEFEGDRNLIGVDPGFVDAAAGDYRLSSISIAINRGDTSLLPGDSSDFAGADRVVDGAIDIGAFEFQGAPDAAREAASTMVTTIDDTMDSTDGDISLREALTYGMLEEEPSSVDFAPALNGAIFVLDGRELFLHRSLTLDGRSVGAVTIDADGRSRTIYAVGGAIRMAALTIAGGAAPAGGGIYTAASRLTLEEMTIGGNTVSGENAAGGGIYNTGDLVLRSVTVSGNASTRDGGGIMNRGQTVLVDTTIQANGAGSHGAGIYNVGDLTAVNTAIRNNATTGSGLYGYSGDVSLVNTLVVGNAGGGILCYGGSLELTNSTVAANTGSHAGIRSSQTVILNNCLVALNSGTDLLVTDGQIVNRDSLIGVDPGFVDPDGGDFRLYETSIAINRGDAGHLPSDRFDVDGDGDTHESLPLDLAGDDRVIGGAIDLGAYEHQKTVNQETPSTVVTTLSDSTDATDGEITLREAIFYALSGAGDTVTFESGLGVGTVTLSGGALVIDGSVVIDASSVGGVTIDAGGLSRGMYVFPASAGVSLVDLTITGGATSGHGGGIYNEGNLILTRVNITGSAAGRSGGGVYNAAGSLTVIDSIVRGNSATDGGGLANSSYGDLEVRGSLIADNTAQEDGGGLYEPDDEYYQDRRSPTLVIDSTIDGNAADRGGGVYMTGSLGYLAMHNVIVTENRADSGGGLSIDESRVLSVGGLFAGNTANYSGGAVRLIHSRITLNQSTVAGNTAGASGGGLWGTGSVVTLKNSILALNTAESGGMDYAADYDSPGWFSPHNSVVGIAPGFMDPAGGNYRLNSVSPAINMGDNELVPSDAYDLDGDGIAGEPLPIDLAGQTRVVDGAVDIGAYEYQGAPSGDRETPSVVVTTPQDKVDAVDGQISLREAIYYAAYADIDRTVTFDPALDSRTIVLEQGALVLSGQVAIDASDVGGVAIDGDGKDRIFVAWDSEADISLSGLTITGGVSNRHGGGMYFNGSSLAMNEVTVTGNQAHNRGGGLYLHSAEQVDMVGVVVRDNSAYYGGGVYLNYDSPMTLVDADIRGNTAYSGGGLYLVGHATLERVVVRDNLAENSGGGIVNENRSWQGITELNEVLIEGNVAGVRGGGLYGGATTKVARTTVRGNSARDGGGIFLSDDGIAGGVRVVGNAATEHGGGVYTTGAEWPLANMAIAGNTAGESGGGVYAEQQGTVALENTTVTGNAVSAEAGSGGGLAGASFTLNNSIVTQNVAAVDPEVAGAFTGANNLVAVDAGFVRNPSSGADGQWGTADDDFGNLRPAAGSPAIDAGDTALLAEDVWDLDSDGDTTEPLPYDLAGNGRVSGAAVDIGAYEYYCLGDFDGNGAFNGLDIPGFKAALADPEGWAAAHPDRAHPDTLGDFDGNGVFNGLDIPGFKVAMAGTATAVSAPAAAEDTPGSAPTGSVPSESTAHLPAAGREDLWQRWLAWRAFSRRRGVDDVLRVAGDEADAGEADRKLPIAVGVAAIPVNAVL